MKKVKLVLYFLGSVYFAIFLIASLIFMVTWGTLIESRTESHRYAEVFTYNNALFFLLLGGFFINILLSTLRRWPFERQHMPFIITHCGLLMIISGIFIKNIWGLQGNMIISEGSGSERIFFPHTFELSLEKRNREHSSIPLEMSDNHLKIKEGFKPNLKIEIKQTLPHAAEQLETWFKKDGVYIFGLPPIPSVKWNKNDHFDASPLLSIPLFSESQNWNIFAFKTDNIQELFQKWFEDNTFLQLTTNDTSQVLYKGSISNLLRDTKFNANLKLSFNPILGLLDPIFTITGKELDRPFHIQINLDENSPLINQNRLRGSIGFPAVTAELSRKPALLFLQDHQNDIYLFVMDACGRVKCEIFRQDNIKSYLAFENGFGGYSVETKIKQSPSRKTIEDNFKKNVIASINRGVNHQSNLIPPLKIFYDSCQKSKIDFATHLVELLDHMNNSGKWILSNQTAFTENLSIIIKNLDWKNFQTEKHGCYWICKLFRDIDPQLIQGKNPKEILIQLSWPLQVIDGTDFEILTNISEQLFSIGNGISLIEEDFKDFSDIELFTALLRAHQIHLFPSYGPLEQETVNIEAPITIKNFILPPKLKLEENTPLISLEIENEKVNLVYDPFLENLKKPILNGEYLIRFQPQFKKIPHHIRLRQARQINYANAEQPFSYECDLICTNLKNNKSVETTLSMNHVYETSNGYRFYLSNIYPTQETAVKQVQLAVNYDPAKYIVTYPGAILLAFGIILIFWKYKKF